MNVRLFQRDDQFFVISSEGANTGYTLSRDLLSCRHVVPDLAFLRMNSAEVERRRAMALLRAIRRLHDYLDLSYGSAVRVVFRNLQFDTTRPAQIVALLPDLPFTAQAGDERVLAYTVSAFLTYKQETHGFFGANYDELLGRSRRVFPAGYADLKAELENRYFPELRPTRFVRPLARQTG